MTRSGFKAGKADRNPRSAFPLPVPQFVKKIGGCRRSRGCSVAGEADERGCYGVRGCGGQALEVVEGGGDLDQSLQEVFLGLAKGEPDGFPVLVGEEELAAVIAGEALGERAASPIERADGEKRGMRIGDGFGFHSGRKFVKIEVL